VSEDVLKANSRNPNRQRVSNSSEQSHKKIVCLSLLLKIWIEVKKTRGPEIRKSPIPFIDAKLSLLEITLAKPKIVSAITK